MVTWGFVSFVVFYLAVIFPASGANSVPFTVPEPFLEEVDFDQMHNTRWRGGQAVELKQTAPIPIYEFRLSTVDARLHAARKAKELLAGSIYDYSDWIATIWIPSLPDIPGLDELKRQFGEPTRVLAGARLLGKATFHVWDPARPQLHPLRVKFQVKMNNKFYNDALAAENSVKSFEVIQNLFAAKPHPTAWFYPEPLGVTVPLSNTFSFSMIVRTIPHASTPLPNHRRVVPLHGFLNSIYLRQMARARGQTDLQWILSEYIPKLARMLAYFHFEMGIWIEAHSQNLSIVLNTETGEIESFGVKDADDVLFAPFFWHMNDIHIERASTLPFRLNEYWDMYESNIHPRAASMAGHHATDFVRQSIAGVTHDSTTKQELLGRFIRKYLQASGLELRDLSPQAARQWLLLQQGEITNLDQVRLPGKIKFSVFGPKRLSPIVAYKNSPAAFMTVMQNIADVVTEKKFRHVLSQLSDGANDNTQVQFPAYGTRWAYEAWAQRLQARQVATVRRGSIVFIYDRKTGRPLGSRDLNDDGCSVYLRSSGHSR